MKKIQTIVLLALFLVGCTKDFEELNTNRNAPEVVDAQFLLSNIIWQAANENTKQGWLSGNFLAQHTSNLEFLPIDRYDLGTNTEYWNHLYRLLNDIENMQQAAPDNEAYQAVGNILKAWVASQLTDLWGDVPFFEAVQGVSNENFTPAFDKQENIYLAEGGILDLLEKAALDLEDAKSTISGDIMYSGDLAKWRQFANTLSVRYLLRISDKTNVGNRLQALVSSGKLFQSNTDNASVPYLAAAPNQWFIYPEREGRYVDVRMSTTAENLLTHENGNDPRLASYFKPAFVQGDTHSVYAGIPNGLSRENQNDYDLSKISLLGTIYRDQPDGFHASFITYSEVQFALAEAASKGLISGDVNSYYETAITAHFTEMGVEMDNYLSLGHVKLDAANELQSIQTQKWISLLMKGHEAWLNYRRTGFPQLDVPKDNLNGDTYPVRYRYPESEQATNSTNYSEAVSRMGGDSYNEKGWWEE